jgi:diguanylate cyclase (GGDEF)-like protein
VGSDGDRDQVAEAGRSPEGRFSGARSSEEIGLKDRETVAVFEVTDANRRRLNQLVQELGYSLVSVEMEASLGESASVVIAALPEERALAGRLLEAENPPVVVASLASPAKTARQRLATLPCDLYAVRPHSSENLGPVLHAAFALARSRRALAESKDKGERLRAQLALAGYSGEVTGFQHFEYFKRLLILEIKRAKRFGYPIAVCLLAPDRWPEGEEPSVEIQRKLRNKAARAMVSSIRDIDIPVDHGDQAMLLFLPYTNLQGALEVAQRATQAVRKVAHTREGDRQVRLSLSCGIAALGQERPISFAKLMKEATAALKEAQERGRGQVVVRE